MYDKATNAEIINSLGGFTSNNFMDELDRLDTELRDNFYKELEETLKGQDYDSETVVKDSLENASKDYFRGMNYQLKRGIENSYNMYGQKVTLMKYEERANNEEFKTANFETIENYIDFLDVLNSIEFYY